jgi:hypothetical protein
MKFFYTLLVLLLSTPAQADWMELAVEGQIQKEQQWLEILESPGSSLEVNDLTIDEYISGQLPEEHCVTSVTFTPEGEDMTEITIVHVARHSDGPHLIVLSTTDESKFNKSLDQVELMWKTDAGFIYGDEGNLSSKIYPDLTSCYGFRCFGRAYNGRATLPQVMVNHYAKHKARINLSCSGLPAWIIKAYPHQEKIKRD